MTDCTKKATHSHQTGYQRGCRCAACSEAMAQYGLKYYNDNKASIALRASNYNKTPDRKANENQRLSVRKRAMKAKPEHVSLMNAIYELCPAGWHVDHILPLSRGGLHEPTNLQYLTASDNLAKNAKTDYTPVTPAIRWQDWTCTL